MYARSALLTVTLVIGIAGTLFAGPVFDFSSLSSGLVTSLGTGATTIGPVTAQAYMETAPNVWEPANLIARNEGNADRGLGVCTEGNANCHIGSTGNGDYNELSQLTTQEAILLSLAPGYKWTGLWVSSLDSGDGPGIAGTVDGKESGIVNWGSSNNVVTLIGSSNFTFAYPDAGLNGFGDILPLPAASSFNDNARYVLFRPNGPLGANNDYLVWGASAVQTVPEPATLALFAIGATLARRRRN